MSHTPVKVNSPYGPRSGGFHLGVDLDTDVGDVLCAPFDGWFTRRNASSRSDGRYFSYGYYWRIDHGNKVITRAAHISKWLRGDGKVKAGERLAESGGARNAVGAGNSTGPHVHYEYEVDGERLDPMKGSGRLGRLFRPVEAIHIGPTYIQWTFNLVYGKPWYQSPGFYYKVKPTLKRLLEDYVRIYNKKPTDAPEFLRKFLANRGVP